MTNSKLPPINEEKLSQLMDGEWDGLNPSDCVAGICNDDALRSKWGRYHLIRDVMKSEPVQVDDKLASSICAAIADEPTYSNITPFSASVESMASESSDNAEVQAAAAVVSIGEKNQTSGQTKAKRSALSTGLTGFAMAASVALVTVVGMNLWQGQSAPQTEGTTVALSAPVTNSNDIGAFSQQIEGAPLPEIELVGNTGARWVSPQMTKRSIDEERLNMFLSQHIENSPTAGREGLISYSRLVGYDNSSVEQ